MPKIQLPTYMKAKPLAGGKTGYYFEVHGRYSKRLVNGRPCPIETSQPLGTDFGDAFTKHKKLLNQFNDWRNGVEVQDEEGSVKWLFAKFKSKDNKAWTKLALRTQQDYETQMQRIIDWQTPKKGLPFGMMQARDVRPANADEMFESLLEAHGDRQGSYAMQVARRVWNWGKRKDLVFENPFLSMGLKIKAKKQTYAPSRAEYELFKQTAKEMGLQHMATAVALAFELVQRPGDVIGRKKKGGGIEGAMAWTDYRPGEYFRISQNKTQVPLLIPMFMQSVHLFPELEEELRSTRKLGSTIVMDPDHKSGVPMPIDEDKFRRLFRKIREQAGLHKDFQFRGLRHGAATEIGDAGVDDVRPMTGHTTIKMSQTYNHLTPQKAAAVAQKRNLFKAEINDALQELNQQ